MFYFLPDKKLIKKSVHQGQIIGVAQDICTKGYPGMIPHIHLEIVSIDPDIFINQL